MEEAMIRIAGSIATECELVIALHCSGSGAAQWRRLGETLGERCELIAPEHYGCESTGHWTGGPAFTLADEAERTIALIDATDRKVHLVGHSYGGGVALHVALARTDRIASLTLYEPSAFYLLKQVRRGRGAVCRNQGSRGSGRDPCRGRQRAWRSNGLRRLLERT